MPTPGKPYDATTRDLFDLGPADWPGYLHIAIPKAARVEVIDSDVSTVTAGADKVLKIVGKSSWILHVEFQVTRDRRMAERLLRYNVLLGYNHRCLVRSTVVLLRPQAGSKALTGTHEMRFPGEDAHLTFRYDVIRAWEQRAEDVLAGGLATLPLVAISDVGTIGIVEALAAMSERLIREASPDQRDRLLKSAWVLTGLSYGKAKAREIWREIEMDVLKIRGIEVSSTYQDVLQQGRKKGMREGMKEGMRMGKAEEARAILLRMADRKFGAPDPKVIEEISKVDDLKRLEALLDRILDATSWEQLLANRA